MKTNVGYLNRVFSKIKNKLDNHTLEVYLNSSKAIIVKGAGIVVGLLVSIFLGRNLGSEGLGVVNFAKQIGSLLLVITMFGFENAVIKFVSNAKAKLDDKGVATATKTSLIFNGLLSIFIASIGAIVLNFIFNIRSNNQHLYVPLLIVFVMIIPQTVSRVYGSALNGYGKIWQANLVNNNLSAFLLSIGLLFYWSFNIQFNPISVLLLYAISRILMAIIVFLIWRQTFKSNTNSEFSFKPMYKMAKPLFLVAGTGIIASNADSIMLGSLGTFKDVGMYTVAARLALLTSIFLGVINSAIKPKIASLYGDEKTEEIQFMVQRVTRGLTFIALFSFILNYSLGKWMLGFWGTEFHDAYWVLVILSIGQFFNVATGCSGMLLIMCGYEKIHGYISLVSVLFNLTLNVILIKNYGALGAAIATAITATLTNISKVVLAKRKTGILTLPTFNI